MSCTGSRTGYCEATIKSLIIFCHREDRIQRDDTAFLLNSDYSLLDFCGKVELYQPHPEVVLARRQGRDPVMAQGVPAIQA